MFWNKKNSKTSKTSSKKSKGRNKNKNNAQLDLLKNQTYLLKIVLPDNLDPQKNVDIKKIINKISVLEKNSENDFESTYPYASFKAIDNFLKNIRDMAIHTNQQNVYLESVELDTWDGSGNKKKIIEVTTLEDVEIKYNFQTILQIIFEEVINDNETGLDVNTLRDFLNDLRSTYIQNTGVSDNYLPEVPDNTVFLSHESYYRFVLPNRNKFNNPDGNKQDKDDLNKNSNESNKKSESKNNEVENNNSNSENPYIESKSKQNKDKNNSEIKSESIIENKSSNEKIAPLNDQEIVNNSKTNNILKKLATFIDEEELSNLSVYNELIENLKNRALSDTSITKSITSEPPAFPIKEIDVAKPYEPHYVEYMLNIKRQQFNVQLKSITDVLNSDAETKVLEIQKAAKKWFSDVNKEFQKKYAVDPEKVKKKVQDTVLEKKMDEFNIESKKIETQFTNERNLVEQDYKAKLANIERNKSLAKQRLDYELANKYSQIEREDLSKELKKSQIHSQELIIEALKPESENMNSNLSVRYNSIRENIMKTLQRAYKKLQATLPEYEKQLQSEYLNAVETHSVEQRAADIGLQNQNIKDLNVRLSEQNERLAFEKSELGKEISYLNEKLKGLKDELSKIPTQNSKQSREIFNQLNELREALDEKKKKNSKLTKEILATGAIIAALGVGGGSLYGINQHHKTLEIKAENNKLKSSRKNLSSSSLQSKSSNSNSSKSGKNVTKNNNSESNANSSNSVLAESLPNYAKTLIKNGRYSQAVKQYPSFKDVIEQKAFENGNLEGVQAANSLGTIYGTIDEAILNGSPNLIVSAYETSRITNLQSAERAIGVGRAYLKRNHLNDRENDYLSAVNVYNYNSHIAPALLNDLQKFETTHKLN